MRRLPALVALLALSACGGGETSTPDAPVPPTVEEGVLQTGDETLVTGELVDEYRRSVSAGDWIRINVQAEGFDPYLIINAPSGQQYEIDDSDEGDTGAVRTAFQTDESGSWTIKVTTYEPGESGSYSLTHHATTEQPVNAGPEPTATEPGVDA